VEVEALAFLGLALVTLCGVGWQCWDGWEKKESERPEQETAMVDPRWRQICQWALACPIFQIEPPRPVCWPIVLRIREDSNMADTFVIDLTFSGEVPELTDDKDPITHRCVKSKVTPIGGGDTVEGEHHFPISEVLVSIPGIPENSRVELSAGYVNDDGRESSEFKTLPSFDVVDVTGPVNLAEDITVEVKEES